MIEVTASADVARPAPELFAFVADMSNNPQWQRGQQRCVWTSDPPIRAGSTYDQRARFLGRDIVSSFEVVEFEPDRRIRIRTVGGSMPMDITREVEPLGTTAPGCARPSAVGRRGRCACSTNSPDGWCSATCGATTSAWLRSSVPPRDHGGGGDAA